MSLLERYFRGEAIDLSPANHEVGRETYSFFNSLSKRLGSETALSFLVDHGLLFLILKSNNIFEYKNNQLNII